MGPIPGPAGLIRGHWVEKFIGCMRAITAVNNGTRISVSGLISLEDSLSNMFLSLAPNFCVAPRQSVPTPNSGSSGPAPVRFRTGLSWVILLIFISDSCSQLAAGSRSSQGSSRHRKIFFLPMLFTRAGHRGISART